MSRITFNADIVNHTQIYPRKDNINTVRERAISDGQYDELVISDEARKLSLKEYDSDCSLKYGKPILEKDYYEQKKLEFAQKLSERGDIDPLINEFQIYGVRYTFKAGTLEQFLFEKLEGKTNNASLVAIEIAKNIRGTVNNPQATVEERAVNRKTALKLAEEIAQNYFDNPQEAFAFLSEINRYAENDILREKGYIVFDNSDLEPFKEYTMPNAPKDYIRGSEYAKKYGSASLEEIFKDRKQFEDFLKALEKNSGLWRKEIIRDYNANERRVQNIIDETVLSPLNEQYVENIIRTFFK